MNQILEIDTANHVAVIQPGVTLGALDAASAGRSLVYPVYPGEMSASLGGTIATNAGGMRAVRYGVTPPPRARPGGGARLRRGDPHRRQAGQAQLRLRPHPADRRLGGHPGPGHRGDAAAVPAPALPGDAVGAVRLAGRGDRRRAAGRGQRRGPADPGVHRRAHHGGDRAGRGPRPGHPRFRPGIGPGVPGVMQEERDPGRLDADVADVAELLARVGAADVYVLPAAAARRLVEAREKAFWAAKRAGADDIVDAVVPRAAMAAFLGEAARIGARHDRLVLGVGHAGDGNVHLALFEPDDAARGQMMREILAAARASGGAVSGEHGIGTAKVSYFLELADPVAVSL